MPDPLLRVRGLHVGFATDAGPARVLDGVDFTVGRGEVVGLVGESGCGKTTLARAILGVLPPAARRGGGEIWFKGEELLGRDPDDVGRRIRGRRITFIPQDPYGSFNPLFSVGTQMMELMRWKSPRLGDADLRRRWPALLTRYPRGRYRQDRAAVLDLLARVQIPDPQRALKKLPHEFSGGQRQRLMIAMALLPEPDLIIADEPTTALDVTIQAQILRLLRDLVDERGISVMFTTHDLGTAYELCDRITVMYAGQEMETAPTESFFSRPSNPYTKRLLDSLPNPEGEIVEIGGEIPRLVDPPPGCRFHPRCPNALDVCRRVFPAESLVEPGHTIHCHNPVRAQASPERQHA